MGASGTKPTITSTLLSSGPEAKGPTYIHTVPAGLSVGPRVNLQGSSMFRDGQKIATC